MRSEKKGASHFLTLGVPLLAAGILLLWLVSKQSSDPQPSTRSMPRTGGNAPDRNTPRQDFITIESIPHDPDARTNVTTHTPRNPDATSEPVSAGVFIAVRSTTALPPDSASGFEMRVERRELSVTIPDLYQNASSPAPESLHFPLFDGKSVHLTSLRHQSIANDQGVVFAEADGEPEGGHVLLSYVGTALAGMIHLPSRGEFYEIRTAPDGRSHILTQLDPDKMPACGTCVQHQGK